MTKAPSSPDNPTALKTPAPTTKDSTAPPMTCNSPSPKASKKRCNNGRINGRANKPRAQTLGAVPAITPSKITATTSCKTRMPMVNRPWNARVSRRPSSILAAMTVEENAKPMARA